VLVDQKLGSAVDVEIGDHAPGSFSRPAELLHHDKVTCVQLRLRLHALHAQALQAPEGV